MRKITSGESSTDPQSFKFKDSQLKTFDLRVILKLVGDDDDHDRDDDDHDDHDHDDHDHDDHDRDDDDGNLQGLVTPSCLLLVRQKLLDLDTNEAVTIMVLTDVVF